MKDLVDKNILRTLEKTDMDQDMKQNIGKLLENQAKFLRDLDCSVQCAKRLRVVRLAYPQCT